MENGSVEVFSDQFYFRSMSSSIGFCATTYMLKVMHLHKNLAESGMLKVGSLSENWKNLVFQFVTKHEIGDTEVDLLFAKL